MRRETVQAQDRRRSIVSHQKGSKKCRDEHTKAVAMDRVSKLRRDYCNVLRNAGFDDLHILNPHIAIEYIIKELRPPQLYRKMTSLVKRRENERFEKEHFRRFINEVFKKA